MRVIFQEGDMKKGRELSEEIAKVAYDLYEKRGCVHGYDFEDWIEAEKIVMQRHSREIEREAEVIGAAKKIKKEGTAKERTRKAPEKAGAKTPATRKKRTTTKKKTS